MSDRHFQIIVNGQWCTGLKGAQQTLKGKKGIIIFEIKGWSDATGHADLWDGGKVVRDDYGVKAHNILFWESF